MERELERIKALPVRWPAWAWKLLAEEATSEHPIKAAHPELR